MKYVLATALAVGIVGSTLLPAFAGEGCTMGKADCAAGKAMACNSKEKAQGGSSASSASTSSDKKDEAVAKVDAEKNVTAATTTEKKEEAKTK
jgi:hypothetical protein